jgi:hypothetical protein
VLAALRQLPRLTLLNLAACQWLNDDTLCTQLVPLSQLLYLNLAHCNLWAVSLRPMVSMPRLTALDVTACINVNDGLFAYLAQHCRSLTALKIHAMHRVLTTAGIVHLSRKPWLRWALMDAWKCSHAVLAAVKAQRRWDAAELAEQISARNPHTRLSHCNVK